MRMHASKERHDARKPSSTCRRFRSTGRKLRPTSTTSRQWRGIRSTTARSKISGVLTSDSPDNVLDAGDADCFMAAPLLGRTLGGLGEPWSDRSQGSLLLAPQVMRRLAGNAALFFACDEEMKSPRERLSRAGARCPTSHLGGYRSGSDYLVPHVSGKIELM